MWADIYGTSPEYYDNGEYDDEYDDGEYDDEYDDDNLDDGYGDIDPIGFWQYAGAVPTMQEMEQMTYDAALKQREEGIMRWAADVESTHGEDIDVDAVDVEVVAGEIVVAGDR